MLLFKICFLIVIVTCISRVECDLIQDIRFIINDKLDLLFPVRNPEKLRAIDNYVKENKKNMEKSVYCETFGNISAEDKDLILCQKKETLSECITCLGNDFKKKKNLSPICVNELKTHICKQIVPILDNCHNRCSGKNKPQGCTCAGSGTCRIIDPSGNDNGPC